MTPDPFTQSQDANNAYLLGEVVDATALPGETASEARTRSAAIDEMFRTFAPADAVESMIACHCISLRFVLNAAMRDAGNVNLEPVLLARMRAMAMSISKTMHVWISKYESLHARNEARAAEAQQRAGQPAVTIATPRPEPVNRPPTQRDQPRPIAPQPFNAILPDVPPVTPFRQPGEAPPMMPATAAPGMKEALLASGAIIQDALPNGRLIGAPGP